MKNYINGLLLLFCFFVLISCASSRLMKDLDPESREFISKVRYIITKKERQVFLNLPKSERQAFIEEFWVSRDPDPDTEENEYKEEYFKRMEEANRLFSEGSPGWLQDRGRFYILLGPPWERYTYPRGKTFYGKPEEIWLYGWFVIRFVDHNWNGDYKFVADSTWQVSELNKAQMRMKPLGSDEHYPFEFEVNVKNLQEKGVSIHVKVPFRLIWFDDKNGQLQTTLALKLEIFDSYEEKVWDYQKEYPISLTEEELKEIIIKDYSINIEVKLPRGKYAYSVELKNLADNNRSFRKGNFKI
ncbi:MAG: GWxTD domain-containing protein [Candidatus Aminicenantes bacterium]|nr:GWxTD domain-containing protein [Candidatus Aminicenantes bacterium]